MAAADAPGMSEEAVPQHVAAVLEREESFSSCDSEGEADLSLHDPRWFAGRIPRGEAQIRVERGFVEGAFLIRESESRQGEYTLTVCCNASGHHVKVLRSQNSYFLDPRKKFKCMDDMLNYYSANSLRKHFDSLATKLTEPRGTTVMPNHYQSQQDMERAGYLRSRSANPPARLARLAESERDVRPRSRTVGAASRTARRTPSDRTSSSDDDPDGDAFAIMFLPPELRSRSLQPTRSTAPLMAAAGAAATSADEVRLQEQQQSATSGSSAASSGVKRRTRSRGKSLGKSAKSFLSFRRKGKKRASVDHSAGAAPPTPLSSDTNQPVSYTRSSSASSSSSATATTAANAAAAPSPSRRKRSQNKGAQKVPPAALKQVQRCLQNHAMRLLKGKGKEEAQVANAAYLLLSHVHGLEQENLSLVRDRVASIEGTTAAFVSMLDGCGQLRAEASTMFRLLAQLADDVRRSQAWLQGVRVDDRQITRAAKKLALKIESSLQQYDVMASRLRAQDQLKARSLPSAEEIGNQAKLHLTDVALEGSPPMAGSAELAATLESSDRPLAVLVTVAQCSDRQLCLRVEVINGADVAVLRAFELQCGTQVLPVADLPGAALGPHSSVSLHPKPLVLPSDGGTDLRVEYTLEYQTAARGVQILAGNTVLRPAKRSKTLLSPFQQAALAISC